MQKTTDDKGRPSPYCSYLPTLSHSGVREVGGLVVVVVGWGERRLLLIKL